MYSVFRDLAIIILSAKFFALVARKCKAPQVVGEIIAGLIIGPCLLNLVQTSDAISIFAEIGVVLLMFSTGLGTNLKELMRAGPIATLIACVGVFVPLVGGTLLYSAFYGFAAVGSPEFYRALFIGTIMTATSVSITVATLQELGHLKSFLGTTIVSAAVIDDVIGIIVLTCVLGASSGEGTGIGGVLIQTVLFFLVAIGVGVVIHFAMKWLDKRNPHTQRITIVSMAFCFAMAYIAEQYFGIADITGAYIAGIVLCAMDDAPYVERRVDISNYVIFAPVFFASIGLKTAGTFPMETGGMEMSEQKQKLGFLARTAQTFDLPADIVAGLPRIELIGNGQLQMENHRGILSYREDEVVVSGGKLLVRIQGSELELQSMSANALLVAGVIRSVQLE